MLRKSLHIIPLSNPSTKFYIHGTMLCIHSFQIKDISFKSTFVPTTSRIWIESNSLTSLAESPHGMFAFVPRNIIATWPVNPAGGLDNIDQPIFETTGSKPIAALDFSVYAHDGVLLPFTSADEIIITIEFTHYY